MVALEEKCIHSAKRAEPQKSRDPKGPQLLCVSYIFGSVFL